MDNQQKILGKRLRSFCKTIGLSRRQIEKTYGFAERRIKSWETGETCIKSIVLADYIKIFEAHGIKISLDSLLNFDEELSVDMKVRVEIS